MSRDNSNIRVRSVAFSHGGQIPPKYTCEGENVNPPLEVSDLPENTRSLALIVEDPDAPRGVYDHWVVWNIPPNEVIGENSRPGTSGKNSFGDNGYGGPCPPSGSHRYFFKVYALDSDLDIQAGSGKKTLQDAMKNHVLASGELMGQFQKRK
jgi:Raf kinase inhibitor-like YbhB/YbcL family protein